MHLCLSWKIVLRQYMSCNEFDNALIKSTGYKLRIIIFHARNK
jgi:hypothetical protein